MFLLLALTELMLPQAWGWDVMAFSSIEGIDLQNYRLRCSPIPLLQVFLRTARILAGSCDKLLLVLIGIASVLSLLPRGPRKKELLYQLVIVPLWVGGSYSSGLMHGKNHPGSDGVRDGLLNILHLTRKTVSFFRTVPSQLS